MIIQKWLDLVLLICILAVSIPFLNIIVMESGTPITSYEPDKTAIDSDMGLKIDEVKKTGADLLMSLVVTDDLIAFPRSIRINNTPIIDIDKAWVTNKSSNLAIVYSNNGAYKLGSMVNWKIKSCTYVNNSNDPYLHYILEP